ncbi:CD3337/EF1877 family mobilome membrane protein [Paenibacillus sp. GCM10023250]|uniref:CD3337/EF1877 family mobilome membrane protein n=1 Tax=Paenibacillus sp. GCM10023250 TaxID=3252648 RepID=UPI0036094B64
MISMMQMPRIRMINLRSRFIFSIVLTLLLAFVVSATVVSADAMDEMIPKDTSTNTLYNTYPSSHYSFQTVSPERHFWQIGAKANDSVSRIYDQMLSGGFLIGVQITRFFNFIAREAFTFSYMNSLIDGAEEIIQNISGIRYGTLGNGLWSGMFGVFASITLLAVLWQIVRFRFLDSLQTMISFLIALVVAFAFFTQAGTFLTFLNDTGNEVAASMYAGLAKPGGLSSSTTTGVEAISEQIWMELVMKPYGMLQFDDATAYETHTTEVDKVLRSQPWSDDRDVALKAAESDFPAVNDVRSDEQMIVLLCNAVFGSIIIGLLSFWSLATIYVRLKLLIHAMVMAVTLLASLLPGREAGLSVVRSQFLKLIGLMLMCVFTMFFLDLSLVVGHMVYNLVAVKAKAGWFAGMLLESVVIFVVFKYKDELGSVFSKAAGHIPMPAKAKSTMVDAVQRNVTRSLYNKGLSKVSGMFNKQETEGVPSSFNPSALSKSNENLNDATTASMQLRYQRQKEAAEQIAAETGQPVQYTPFVSSVNANLRTNTKNPFRGMDKEWKEEKGRLSAVQKDGGDVRQAILSQGISEEMNDQQVAATMYANENAIRQASTFMVNRPKAVVGQLQRAGTLNQNRKLETSVNDFVMVELFQRYKVEYIAAIDTSAALGESVKHSDFVKKMDERFMEAGLTSTNQINQVMTTRKGRISYASRFESMPEFGKKKDDLLRANEAFRKATGTVEEVHRPVAPIRNPAPSSTASVLRNAPALPTATSRREAPIALTTIPVVQNKLDMSQVKLPSELKKSMDAAQEKLSKTARMEVGDRLELKAETNVHVFSTLKQRVTPEVSTNLSHLNQELEVMQRAKVGKQTAKVTKDTNQVVKKNTMTAQQTRKNLQRPIVE